MMYEIFMKRFEFYYKQIPEGKHFILPENWKQIAMENKQVAEEFLKSDLLKDIVRTDSPIRNVLNGDCNFTISGPFLVVLDKKKYRAPNGVSTGSNLTMVSLNPWYKLAAAGALTGNLEADQNGLIMTLAHEKGHLICSKVKAKPQNKEEARLINWMDEIHSDVYGYQVLCNVRGGLTKEQSDAVLETRKRFEEDPDRHTDKHPSRNFRDGIIRSGVFNAATVDLVAKEAKCENQELIDAVKKHYAPTFERDDRMFTVNNKSEKPDSAIEKCNKLCPELLKKTGMDIPCQITKNEKESAAKERKHGRRSM